MGRYRCEHRHFALSWVCSVTGPATLGGQWVAFIRSDSSDRSLISIYILHPALLVLRHRRARYGLQVASWSLAPLTGTNQWTPWCEPWRVPTKRDLGHWRFSLLMKAWVRTPNGVRTTTSAFHGLRTTTSYQEPPPSSFLFLKYDLFGYNGYGEGGFGTSISATCGYMATFWLSVRPRRGSWNHHSEWSLQDPPPLASKICYQLRKCAQMMLKLVQTSETRHQCLEDCLIAPLESSADKGDTHFAQLHIIHDLPVTPRKRPMVVSSLPYKWTFIATVSPSMISTEMCTQPSKGLGQIVHVPSRSVLELCATWWCYGGKWQGFWRDDCVTECHWQNLVGESQPPEYNDGWWLAALKSRSHHLVTPDL